MTWAEAIFYCVLTLCASSIVLKAMDWIRERTRPKEEPVSALEQIFGKPKSSVKP